MGEARELMAEDGAINPLKDEKRQKMM